MSNEIIAGIATCLERAPFPFLLRRFLRYVSNRAADIHQLAPLVVALVFGYVAAEITLWAARQPLLYLWPFFGWISGRDPSRLSAYNWLAHTLAFAVAAKVVFELRPIRT